MTFARKSRALCAFFLFLFLSRLLSRMAIHNSTVQTRHRTGHDKSAPGNTGHLKRNRKPWSSVEIHSWKRIPSRYRQYISNSRTSCLTANVSLPVFARFFLIWAFHDNIVHVFHDSRNYFVARFVVALLLVRQKCEFWLVIIFR